MRGTPVMTSREHIALAEQYGAHNYHPLPVVISRAQRVWVWDAEGNKYLDMLSSYSALNHGHRHPKLLEALREQADAVTLTSRAFHNDRLGAFLKRLCAMTGMEKALPMNTGAEAVETALKAIRKWAYQVKGLPENKAELVVCADNFHGRTVTIVSFSSEPQYREGFGPFTPGFRIIEFGKAQALREALTPNTAAFLVEPIQGEAGVLVPPDGYLKEVRELCTDAGILLALDEIQTGLGRTGKLFAYHHEDVRPDVLIVGKALGGGIYPVSAALASREVMDVFQPGDHGSTFGGNPLACAVALASLDVLEEEKLVENSSELGAYFMEQLRAMKSPHVKEVRGKGLFIGVEVRESSGTARPFCERLMAKGILAKETHHQVVRFAPPLVITKEELDWAMPRIEEAFAP